MTWSLCRRHMVYTLVNSMLDEVLVLWWFCMHRRGLSRSIPESTCYLDVLDYDSEVKQAFTIGENFNTFQAVTYCTPR